MREASSLAYRRVAEGVDFDRVWQSLDSRTRRYVRTLIWSKTPADTPELAAVVVGHVRRTRSRLVRTTLISAALVLAMAAVAAVWLPAGGFSTLMVGVILVPFSYVHSKSEIEKVEKVNLPLLMDPHTPTRP
jgi:hypothetical protein